jgi:hypothetical protein
MTTIVTHEDYIKAVVNAALDYPDANENDREAIRAIKLVYGAGQRHTRGVTYFDRWRKGEDIAAVPLVEICAFGQQDWVQVAGTTLHELGHVCAGMGHGHDNTWKAACARLGLINILAAGTEYGPDNFDPVMWKAIQAIPLPNDGKPCQWGEGIVKRGNGSCTLGFGTMGGTSRGPGSGSRLRLYECECVPPVKVRAARDDLDCTCNVCRGLFIKQEKKEGA